LERSLIQTLALEELYGFGKSENLTFDS